jgi:phage tail sheath protein FI
MPALVNRKTPGVYITELAAFPPSITGVPTAVPAFIGYTEKASLNGTPWTLMPTKIGSMADFEAIFGGPFRPLYDLTPVTTPGTPPNNYDFKVFNPVAAADQFYKLDESAPPQPQYNLYDSMQLFYANGGGNCYVVSVGVYPSPVTKDDFIKGLKAIKDQQGPTMLVIPEAIRLGTLADFGVVAQAMLEQCNTMQDRVAILDVYGTDKIDDLSTDFTLDKTIANFRLTVGEKYLNYGISYFPFLYSTVIDATEITFQNISAASFGTLQDILSWQATNLYGDVKAAVIKLMYIDLMVPLGTTPLVDQDKLNKNLIAAIPLLGEIEGDIVDKNNVLPPSAAMAGVYNYVDGTAGVWNAPANIALTSVDGPTYLLTGDQQGDLNVPLDGKAIDAIREFTGRGTVVWGARTLDGNSGDYRYIQVRRTLIFIEQSIKLALNQFVFAPNDGTTWTTVTAMISSFLQGVWSAGGLMGATPASAFTVQCGLGSTMTAKDILDGYMRVQVVLQMIRPAEFIELTFKQKMEAA